MSWLMLILTLESCSPLVESCDYIFFTPCVETPLIPNWPSIWLYSSRLSSMSSELSLSCLGIWDTIIELKLSEKTVCFFSDWLLSLRFISFSSLFHSILLSKDSLSFWNLTIPLTTCLPLLAWIFSMSSIILLRGLWIIPMLFCWKRGSVESVFFWLMKIQVKNSDFWEVKMGFSRSTSSLFSGLCSFLKDCFS